MTDTFRVYTNPDVVGCEIAGALKNVVALAAGTAAGLGLRRQHAGGAHHAWARRAHPPRCGARRRAAHVRRAWPGSATSSRRARARRAATGRSGWSSVAAAHSPTSWPSSNMVAEGVHSTAAVLELAHRVGRRHADRVDRRRGALRRSAPRRPRERAHAARGEVGAPRPPVTATSIPSAGPTPPRRRPRRHARRDRRHGRDGPTRARHLGARMVGGRRRPLAPAAARGGGPPVAGRAHARRPHVDAGARR